MERGNSFLTWINFRLSVFLSVFIQKCSFTFLFHQLWFDCVQALYKTVENIVNLFPVCRPLETLEAFEKYCHVNLYDVFLFGFFWKYCCTK